MIAIDDMLISDEVVDVEFVCNLNVCKGACCVEGDSGAPLEEEELVILEQTYDKIKSYIPESGIQAIETQGLYVIDEDGDYVTPLVEGNKHCAFVFFDEQGIAKCSIEKAYNDNVIDFKKPISCHLYPVRVKKYKNYTAINYHKWQLCDSACTLGQQLQVPVYKFLKDPLIRKFGTEWYEQLCKAAKRIKKP